MGQKRRRQFLEFLAGNIRQNPLGKIVIPDSPVSLGPTDPAAYSITAMLL